MWTWENVNRSSTAKRFGAGTKAIVASALISISALVSPGAPAGAEPFVEKFPDFLTEFKMLPVPGGTVTIDGKTVAVKPFFMSQTEIPWEVFEIWALEKDRSADELVRDGSNQTAAKRSRPSRPYAVIFTNFGHHGFPAICMSFHSATEFTKWLSEKTKRKYRLPTVAEWQVAAQLPPEDLAAAAWTWDNADDTTHKVGLKKPNSLGLYDLFGNVAEWTIGLDNKPYVSGGSWQDKPAEIRKLIPAPEDAKWNESDPQNPKSRWWLANGQHIGIRLVCESQ